MGRMCTRGLVLFFIYDSRSSNMHMGDSFKKHLLVQIQFSPHLSLNNLGSENQLNVGDLSI